MRTAVLIDGAFFIRRHVSLCGIKDAAQVAKDLQTWSLSHLRDKTEGRRSLYRIFFYDCPPLEKKVHRPISRSALDYSKTPQALFRKELHAALGKTRKVALRLGKLSENSSWRIRNEPTKKLIKHFSEKSETPPSLQLSDDDFEYETKQKGVDMRIGLDIASLAYKRQVDQIVLFSGDSDFVPAAKLARREGIDFVLDPMWAETAPDLELHVDGVKSYCPRKPENIRPGRMT